MRRGVALGLIVVAGTLAPAVSAADPGNGRALGHDKAVDAVEPVERDPPGQARGIERRADAAPQPAPSAEAAEPRPPSLPPAREPATVAPPAATPPAAAEPAAPAPTAPAVPATPGPSAPRPATDRAPAVGERGPANPVAPARARAAERATPAPTAASTGAGAVPHPRRERPEPTGEGRPEREPERDEARPAAPGPVVRILEMIPPEVGLALLALAVLGLGLGAATVAQTLRSRRLERARRALVADVGVLQSALLPDLPAVIGGARVSAAYRPADGLAAGGDFFDAFALDGGRTAVVVGDVAGHGRDVVPLTAAVRYTLRAYVEAGFAPRAVLQLASSALAGQLCDRQATVAVAVFDPDAGRLTYACAGHWPPVLLGVPGQPVTACSSPPLGAGVATGRRQTTVRLPPGAAAVFFTDGLLDAIAGGRRIGPDGLRAVLDELGPRVSAGELLDRLAVTGAEQTDDMAACVLAPLPDSAARSAATAEELEVDAAALSSPRVARFLRACDVPEQAATRAMSQAREVVGRSGTAVLSVAAGRVAVAEPAALAMRPTAARETASRGA